MAFAIDDWDFFELPRISLLERPSWLSGQRSHLGINGLLCYARRDELLLNPRKIEEIIDNCLAQGQRVLEDIAANKTPTVRDEEFFSLWSALATPFLTNFDANKPGRLIATELKRSGDTKFYVFTDDESAAHSHAIRLGWEARAVNSLVILVKLTVPPAFLREEWPPKTFAQVCSWLRKIDVEAEKAIRRALENELAVNSQLIFILLQCTLGCFGFWFCPNYVGKAKRYYERRPRELPNRLLNHTHEVHRFICEDISAASIVSRNIPSRPNLSGKRVLVVGCGTIGGYLSSFLARVGAGALGGELVLVDKDWLTSGNLGRHVLTLSDLHRPKSVALAELIQKTCPFAKTLAVEDDIRKVTSLDTFDLIVDATGSTIVSMWLNSVQRDSYRDGKRFPPILHSWIEGQGEAAAAFLSDAARGKACYECLWIDEIGQPLRLRFPQLLARDASDGFARPADCSSYMPYPVSASVEAASLATKLALDWVSGEVKHRFLTRQIQPETTKQVKERNPDRAANCPACKP